MFSLSPYEKNGRNADEQRQRMPKNTGEIIHIIRYKHNGDGVGKLHGKGYPACQQKRHATPPIFFGINEAKTLRDHIISVLTQSKRQNVESKASAYMIQPNALSTAVFSRSHSSKPSTYMDIYVKKYTMEQANFSHMIQRRTL